MTTPVPRTATVSTTFGLRLGNVSGGFPYTIAPVVQASARRELGHHVILVDPFGITGQPTHALNWLDTLDPDSPDVVIRAPAWRTC